MTRTTRSASATLHPTSLLRPAYTFLSNIHYYGGAIAVIARKKFTLNDLLRSDATLRPPARHRRPPISAIPQQPSFLLLSKFLRFSPRTNTLRPGRDQPRDPLDVPATFALPSSLSGRAVPRLDHHLSSLAPKRSFGPPVVEVLLFLHRLRDGQLPQNSASYMMLFAIIFGVIAGIKIMAAQHNRPYTIKWIPSGIAFAIGFLNTPSFSLARLIGGIIEYMYHKRVAKSGGADIRLIVVASGFVLGDGVISWAWQVVGAVLGASALAALHRIPMWREWAHGLAAAFL
ncbi:hypothetical protein DFJ58DRAFT_748988 [Suillus subalutaceus]|uniref:uncharacterized protein n=1 Tax=Suillus subalutaceus TaxID=48586 RepID=UPI001B85EE8E|nr:uncharacterized protein DFJ58DRAFT_748988 [Suillus subalutaceus]KAG1839556.1 hypothetical protein DFJ58DRAFT_748988 [Suillus subalutaceus]